MRGRNRELAQQIWDEVTSNAYRYFDKDSEFHKWQQETRDYLKRKLDTDLDEDWEEEELEECPKSPLQGNWVVIGSSDYKRDNKAWIGVLNEEGVFNFLKSDQNDNVTLKLDIATKIVDAINFQQKSENKSKNKANYKKAVKKVKKTTKSKKRAKK